MTTRFITVIVQGRAQNQVLFVNNEEFESTLLQTRALLTEQGIDTGPGGSCTFLTPTGNTVSAAQEALVTLKQITSKQPAKNKPHPDSGESEAETLDNKSEASECEKPSEHLLIRIQPASNAAREGDPNVSDSVADATNEATNPNPGGQSTTTQMFKGRKNKQKKEMLCPFRDLKDVFNIHDYMNMKTLIKLCILLVFLSACLAFVLTSVVHILAMTMGVFNLGCHHHAKDPSYPSSPGVPPAAAPIPQGSAGFMDLELKLQKAELESSHRAAELEKKLHELEDMYLRDLKMYIQEIAVLKAQVSSKGDYQDGRGKKDYEKEKKKEKKYDKPSADYKADVKTNARDDL